MTEAPSLRTLREGKKLLQKDVAEHLGILPSAYCMIEHGERSLSLDRALKLADLFGVSVVEIHAAHCASRESRRAEASSHAQ